jgi:hypothetical protein
MSGETPDDNERRREKPEVTPQPHKPEVDPNRRTPDKIDPPKEPSPDMGPEQLPENAATCSTSASGALMGFE